MYQIKSGKLRLFNCFSSFSLHPIVTCWSYCLISCTRQQRNKTRIRCLPITLPSCLRHMSCGQKMWVLRGRAKTAWFSWAGPPPMAVPWWGYQRSKVNSSALWGYKHALLVPFKSHQTHKGLFLLISLINQSLINLNGDLLVEIPSEKLYLLNNLEYSFWLGSSFLLWKPSWEIKLISEDYMI